MREEVTALQTFKSKHGPALSKFTNGLMRFTSGAILGSVVTAGVYTGAIEPAKFFKHPAIGQGEIVKAAVAPTIQTDGNLNFFGGEPPVQPQTANTDEIPKTGAAATAKSKMKLDLDLDPASPFAEQPKRQVLELDPYTEETFDLINTRANDELDGIAAILKTVDENERFSDDTIKGSAKSEAVLAMLDLARVAKNPGVAQYDDHVFKVAKGLPNTTTFNDIVETLNWKRETVRNAIDLTTKMAWAMSRDDAETADVLIAELSDLMDKYEMATTVEKATEKLVDALSNSVEDNTPKSLEPSLGVPDARDVSAGPLDRLRGHVGSTPSRSSVSLKL
ncbi:hypothetical protein [Rhizobium sp. BK176]|uniref:hypothetical protein n=1 Tax=Rhizobium sp. BK176 TaxID=2587071 RepID=UPI00216924CE|nr:hypothetical protein [Rhizobium sp. BK176]MCS4089490.1 hypothetical protein [Rhizobium sp. BK176]